MNKIKARFIGEDFSLGYRKGQVYTLQVMGIEQSSVERFFRPIRYQILISAITPFARDCAYENIETFLQNWTDIKTEKL